MSDSEINDYSVRNQPRILSNQMAEIQVKDEKGKYPYMDWSIYRVSPYYI